MATPSTRSDSTPAAGPALGLWQRLTLPSDSIILPEARRQAQLLSAYLVLATPLAAFASALAWLYTPFHSLAPSATIAAAACAVAYRLSRGRRLRLGIGLVVGVQALTPYVGYLILQRQNPAAWAYTLPWASISLLGAGLFYGMRGLAVAALLNLAALIAVPLTVGALDWAALWFTSIFLAAWSAGIAVLSLHLRRIEHDRRTDLMAASEALRAQMIDRERAQHMLAEEKNTLHTILASVPNFVFVKDLAGRFVMVSRGTAGMLGVTEPEAAVGKTEADFLSPGMAASYCDGDDALLHSRATSISREIHGADASGRAVWHLITKVPWRDSEGRIVGIVGAGRDVTARKEAEEAARQTEARHRTLVEQLPAITYVLAYPDTTQLLYISPQVKSWLGYTPDECAADPKFWWKVIHPEDRERVAAGVRRSQGTVDSLNMDFRLVSRDGRTIWVYDHSAPVNDLAGRPSMIQGVMLDITEAKKAEQALRDSEQRATLVSWATNDAVWDWDMNTDTIRWNEGLQRLFQYSPDDLSHHMSWWLERIHAEDRDRVSTTLQQAVDGGQQFWSKEYRFRRADGSYADVFDRGYVLRDEAGRPLRTIGAIMDISDRKRVETALREAETQYRTLVEQLPAVVYVAEFGAEGHWHYVSPQIQTLVGFTPAEWLADPGLWFRQIHPDDRAQVLEVEAKDRALEEGGQSLNEYRMHARDGRLLWIRDSAVVLPGKAGRPLLYHGVMSDITEQKHAQVMLQEANLILSQWLGHSERRSVELDLLNKLSSRLQNCEDIEQACVSIADPLRRLFAEDPLGLYVIRRLQSPPAVVPVWVVPPVRPSRFGLDDCWGLQSGEIRHVDSEHPGPACRHLSAPAPAAYLCVPILAQGEAVALLHLHRRPSSGGSADSGPVISDASWRLARTVADTIGLAFSNLRLRERLREQSIRDPLTDLYNRRYMEESLERELHRAARYHLAVGIIMLDLDHFKQFNDSFGHAVGDMVLRELGRLLRLHVRGADIACRYGGEEFILILPDASSQVTGQRAEHLLAEVRQLSAEHDGQALGVLTASAGVANYPDNGMTGEEVLRAADEALYRAKREGRNRVAVR